MQRARPFTFKCGNCCCDWTAPSAPLQGVDAVTAACRGLQRFSAEKCSNLSPEDELHLRARWPRAFDDEIMPADMEALALRVPADGAAA